MSRFFYPRLAVSNIKKNEKVYIPYLLTCIGTIMMFYNMSFLTVSKDIGNLSDSGSLRSLLYFGSIVIAIFSVIFLFYTNSFLIKRRKKEFGLFNILGMEKRHIARIMFFETLLIGAVSLVVGILGGILLSKIMILLLFKIISFEVTFGFEIPKQSLFYTVALFSGIFIVNLIYNLYQVYRSKPIELLKGGSVGEREPKTKWILAVISVICLGSGYYIAVTTESPLAALQMFFYAVVLVIVGTYCLFTAGSVVILKMLRKNKKYYYKLNHFISVSGMIYRMKQNAAGLANICILSTAVIVMLSTTISMYAGMEDVLRNRYPRNIIVSASDVSEEEANKLTVITEQQIEEAGIHQENIISYRPMGLVAIQNGSNFTRTDKTNFSSNNIAEIIFITIEDYNRMEGKSELLSSGEALVYTFSGNIPGDTLNFNGLKISIKEHISSINSQNRLINVMTKGYYVVVDNANTIKQISSSLSDNRDDAKELSYYYGFDVSEDKDVQIKLVADLRNTMKEIGVQGYVEGAESSRESFYSLYGGLFFLGIFLGLLFIMATVLIIYYKQIAEGYDDKERFQIMQKVGMSHGEVKKAIQSQVVTVFFLPLITAVIHLAFAFNVITKLLSVFNLTNIPLFATCTAITVLVFGIFYAIVYALTARTYYKIVS